ncbi:MAG: HlyD family secretion protein [Calditrichia bacterium]
MNKQYLFYGLLSLLFLLNCNKGGESENFTGVMEGTAVQLPALTGGQIVRMYVQEGQYVEAGDSIALIDTTELALQVKQLWAGLGELDAQAESAKLTLKQAATDLEYIKDKYNRTEELFRKKSVTRQTLDDLTNQLHRAETAMANARQNIQRIKAGKAKLSAQIKLVRKKISDAVILAPLGGTITTKYFERSEAVPPGSPIVEILDIGVMEVKIFISEKMLSEVKYGQAATIRVDGTDQEFKGKVSWISPRAEFTPKSILTEETRTSLVYAVTIKVANPDGILKHGMPVEVAL